MNAINLLEAQHKEVEDLFKRVEAAKEHGEKRRLFEDIASKLVAHDAIERQIFYPTCEKAMGMTDLLGEALVEHGVIEFSLYLADEARGDDLEHKIQVLSEIVEHHVKEEEQEFFPKVEKALGRVRLEELGVKMKARFDQLVAEDFRGPLHSNLQQVLAGATKTHAGKAARKAVGVKAGARKMVPKKGVARKAATAKKTAARPAKRGAHGKSRASARA